MLINLYFCDPPKKICDPLLGPKYWFRVIYNIKQQQKLAKVINTRILIIPIDRWS